MSSSTEKKTSRLKNLSKNLPLKARLFIGVMLLVSTGAVVLTFVGIASLGDDSKDDAAGINKSSVDLGATGAGINRAKVGEALNFGEDSPKAKAVEEAREQKIEKARITEGGGFMDPVSLGEEKPEESDLLDQLMMENESEAFSKISDEASRKPVATGLDDIRQNDRDRERQNKRLEEMAAKANGVSAANARTLPGTQYAYVNRYGDELTDDFMKAELARAKGVRDGIVAQAGGYGSDLGSYTTGGNVSALGGLGSDKSAQTATRSSTPSIAASSDPYMSQYLRDRREDAAPDFDSLRLSQSLANREVERRFGSNGPSITRSQRDDSPISVGGPTYEEQRADSGYVADAGKPIKSVGDICYAQLNMPVNTDAPTPIKATILDYNCGKLRGAKLISEPKRVGETVALEFSVMNYKGEAKPMSAIALDPESNAGFMADDVNRHLISRYLSLAVAAGLPGWADSVRGTETEENSNGDETTRTPAVSGIDQVAVITGAIAEAIVPAMQKNFSRPPTVKLDNGRPILVMFMDDIRVD